jgi:prolyl-tRNA synthetase
VGNIFNLGTTKSEPLGLTFTDEDGTVKPVIMGSYGIGPARVMGVIVERYADEKGLVWPEGVAPADIHLVRLGQDDDVIAAAEKLYDDLQKAGKKVLFDDRDVSAGAKFGDADLMGVPLRYTISKKTLAEESVEVKVRTSNDSELVKISQLV